MAVPEVQAAEIRVSARKNHDYYAWIVFLSEGPITWRSIPPKTAGEDPKSVGRAYRIVQLVSEIYDTILVEEVTLGNEGCCKKVSGVSEVDLDGFTKAFGFVGEISGFTFVKWESPTSFRFRFREREFVAAGLGRSSLTISEASAPTR
ncbi:hypothetical protein E6H36_09325 [Candidatus Bathyarchaeota archaeon]|nr:MAG: hypothetical protein E6H36_09325 [Candidatus Bathyarchaeota archaeon]